MKRRTVLSVVLHVHKCPENICEPWRTFVPLAQVCGEKCACLLPAFFVSSPVGRRSPTTAAGPPERHKIASASPTPARRQQGGATAPFPGTGRGPPARGGKGSSPGEIGVGFTTAQLEQLGAAIQSAVVPLSDTLTREVTALRARVDYLNARVDTEVASRTPVIRAAPQSVSSEGLSGVSITGFGERPEFPRSSFPSSPPMSRSPGLSAAAGMSVPPPPPAPIHRVATGTAPEVHLHQLPRRSAPRASRMRRTSSVELTSGYLQCPLRISRNGV